YSHLLPKGQHPVLFLFLSMDPALMDVNVHPAKAEVRFARQKEVHRFLSQAVRDALRENQKACSLTAGAPGPEQGAAGEGPPGAGSRDPKVHDREGPEAGERAPGTYPSPSAGSPGYAGGPGKHVYGGPAGTARGRPDTAVPSCGDQVPLAEAWGRFVQPGENGEGRGWGPPGGAGLETPPRPVSDLMYSDFEPLGQLDQSFIVLQGKRGLLLVDQHIAHERVLYERFRAAARHRAVEVQSLMFPLAVEFDPAPAALLEAHRERLRDLGLELDAFGPRGFLLRAVPAILKNQDHEAILRDIVRMLGGEVSGHNALDAKFEEIQILMACRNAIKVNHPLGLEQIRKLLHDLENTEMPHTCPHGRPIALLVETGAILKGFHRR
ncbi:MAG: DNA mismatch repair protein MutL, partial [Nitrospinaceae bacterium]